MLRGETAGHVPTECGQKPVGRRQQGEQEATDMEQVGGRLHRVHFKCFRPNLLLYYKFLHTFFKKHHTVCNLQGSNRD